MAKAKESYEEWKKRKEQEGTLPASTTQRSATSAGSSYKPKESYEEWKARKEGKTSSNNLITSFLTDSRAYLSSAQKEYDSLNYQTGKSTYVKRMTDAERLKARGRQIQQYIDRSGNSSEYADLKKYLEDFEKSADNVLDAFHSSADFYGQFESEEKYNEYAAYQKDREEKSVYDLDAGQKEIATMEQELAELKRQKSTDDSVKSMQNLYAGSTYAAAQGDIKSDRDLKIREMEQQLSSKKQYLNDAKRIQDGATLASVSGNDDFEAYKGYVSTQNDSVRGQFGMGYDDLTYEYINGEDNGMRQSIINKAVSYDADTEKFFSYDHMTPDQIAIYNYHYAKDGKEAAEKYLNSIQETLNDKAATERFEKMKGRTALELVFGLEAGLDQFQSGVKNLFNTNDDYIPQTAKQMASGMAREDLADNGFNFWYNFKDKEWQGTILGSSVGQVAYDAITTSANMAPSILASIAADFILPGSGAYVGSGLMGASAAGNAYQEALNDGYDKDQARGYGLLVGASEIAMEKVLGGISAVGGNALGKYLTQNVGAADTALKMIGKRLGASVLSEFTEEYLQEVLTPVFQNIMLDTNNEVKLFSAEALYSGILGALTAGIMEGPTVIGGEVRTNRTGKQLKAAGVSAQRLADIGKTFAADTVAYQLAGRVSENTGAYTIGRLFNEIGATLTEQNVNDITEALVAKGWDRDVAAKNAKVMAAVVNGEKLSDKQVAIIEANDSLAEAMRTTIVDPNATWFQRNKGYNDIAMTLAQKMTAPKSAKTKQSLPGQDNAVASEQADTAEEVGTEETPAPPRVQSITRVQGEDVTVKLEDGSEVSIKDADLDPDEGMMIETIARIDGISAEDANYIFNALKAAPGARADFAARGAEEAYRYGYYGFDNKYITEHGVFANSLTETQRKTIYEKGRDARQRQVANKNATVAKKNATTEKSSVTGKVYFDGDRSVLTDRQSASLSAMETVAKVLGVQIYVFESEVNERGKRIGANGWYDPKDSSIHIDLHAGAKGEGTMLFTLAHELTHHIRKWSPAKFKILADLLMQEYGKKGVNVDALVREQMAKAKRNGRTISYDTAYEEVVADSMETMLSDGAVLEKLEKLKQKDESLWQKIKDFISELAAKIRNAYEGMTPDSVEGRYVAEMVDSIEKLQELFTEGLVEASENFQSAEKNTTQEGGDILHSLREFEDGTRFVDVQMDAHTFDGMTVAEMNKAAKTILIERFAGKVIGIDNRVFVNGDSVNEYLHPSKSIDAETRKAKLTAAGELDNLLDAGTALPNKPDGADGHIHPDAIDFSYFKTIFKVGNEYFEGIVNIKNIKRGKLLKDVTKIRNITQDIVSSYGENPKSNFLRDVSMYSIRNDGDIVKNKSAEALDIAVDSNTESVAPAVLFSERTWTESDYVQEREKAAEEISKAIGVSKKKAKAYIDSVNSIAKMIAEDRVRLDYFSSPNRSSFVSNVEYGGSFDFSTLCKKRRLLTGTFTAIQKALPNTALTANEILDIRNRMKDKGLEVSCGLCYVEGSRANMGQFAKEFLKLYKQYYPDAWQPNMADVNTPDGIEWVRINHPECYEQYEYFWNHYGTLKEGDKNLFASQQKPKLYQLHTEYKGEILQKFQDDDNVEEKNLNGGIRLQSFSDFEIVHLIDTMQIIMDMSRVGLAGQAYTKVPDFAWALGDTGLKINLSLIAKGVDENGKLIFDDVEGMPIADAMKLRERYSKNVGTILVAFNDAQLLAAMADDRVDFIIPFHRSQWKKSQYEAMGLPAKTKDYTYMQNEKFIKPQYHEYRGRMVKDKATNYMPNEYWDFSKSGKENAVAYLEMCARNNKRPKFYKLLQNNGDGSYSLKVDGSTDGYWKLLIDFKMYDNDGVGSPQMPVKPDFNMEEATRMLDEYSGGHSNFPVAQGIVDDFVKEYKDSHKDIKYSDRGYLDAVNRGDMETAQKMVDAAAKADRDLEAEEKYSDRNSDGRKGMDDSEISAIQNIGRISVNAFASRDIKATEKLAKRYWEEMGVKSPFFRAWFGDWRVNDQTQVQIADRKGDTRGVQHNDDTGWDIAVSGQVFNETKSHRGSANKNAQPYLPYINDIVRKAVLLDSYGIGVGKAKSDNSLLMHSMYAVADIGNGPEVLKLYVEEMNNPVSDLTTKRSYQLQNIEKAFNVSVRVQGQTLSSLTSTLNAIKIVADLFAAVKQYDTTFSPNPVSKAVNIDGIPKEMYHGTSNSGFTIFNTYGGNFGLFGKGSYFTDNSEVADSYTRKGKGQNPGVYGVYLSIKNPLDMDANADLKAWKKAFEDAELDVSYLNGVVSNEDAFRQLKENLADEGYLRWEAEDMVTELIEGMGYDGITHIGGGRYGTKDGPKHRVYIAFEPEQIKSSTENIGTFDVNNPDIRYQDRDTYSVSNRSLLANAFEGVAQNETERNRIREYRKKISQMEEQERKLGDLNQQIKELSFAKGPRDTAKIKELREEAIKITNRINIFDKQLIRLEASAPLQAVLDREKKKAYKRAEQKGKEALTEYKKKAMAEQQEIAERYRESRKKAISKAKESRDKREAREKLQKLVLDTAKWISHPAKTAVKCPDILKQPYADFLNSIDMSSERLSKGGDPTKNDLRLANSMGSLATALEKVMASQDPTQDTTAVLDAGYLDLPANFVQKLRDMTEDVKAMMIEGEYVVNTMTAEEVRKLSQMIRTLNHAIKEVSTLYANLRFANVEMLGDESMSFMDAIGEIQKTSGMKDFVQWENALPYYAFKRFGKGGESIFEGLMDAQDKLAFLAQKIFNFQEKTWKGDEAKKWSEDTHTIDLPDGEQLTLTTADAMSIYCLSRRQQGLQHLLGGGVRVMGIRKDSQKAKDSRSTLTIKDIDAIISSLTDRQKKVAEAIQEFMSTTCSEWGNEISMKRFLTKEFNEKFYFPIESNDENLPTKDPSAQQSDLFRLLNISATKAIDPRANNEVIIRNIFDVFTGHASDMARLNAFGLPLLDYMKWLNYREKTVNEEGQIKVRGVRKYMETAYGNAAKSYVLNLIKDVNGRPSDNGDPSILMKWMRSAKTASVGSSLRVATLQITSYPRAALVLSPKSLALGLTKVPNIEKAKKYCGIALWKSFGFYDTNISRSIEEQMKGVKDVKQKLIEFSLKGAELGDAITWGAMWNACEYEVASTKKYKVGSEEFYEAVGKKLREVVYRTQVVDSTLTRSQIMRSKRGMTQEAATFMSEPTLSANILMDAGMEFNLEKRRTNAKTAWNKTGKYVTNALAVYSIGQLTAALLEGLWDAWRDDEDEKFGDKFVSAFTENLVMDLVPFNKIPIVSDVFEAGLAMIGVGFYSSDKMSTTWLTQAVSAADAWRDVIGGNSSVTTYNALYKSVRALSSFYGVSASGVMREGVDLWNNTAGAYDLTLKVLSYARSKAELGSLLLDAIIEGNDRQADSLRAEFEDEDAYQSALRSAIKERYLAGEIDTSTAQEYLALYGGKDGSKAYWLTEEWMFESDSDEEFGKYNKFFDAVKTGKNLKAVIKEYTSNGVKPETLAGQITEHFKPEYMEMTKSEKASIKGYLLNAFEQCGVKREDAAKKIQHWEFLSEYPDSGLTQSQVENYHEFAKTAGISAKLYIDYCHKAKGISKKEDLMDIIDSLPITSAQKDALYYAEGWAKSKLNEAPWH